MNKTKFVFALSSLIVLCLIACVFASAEATEVGGAMPVDNALVFAQACMSQSEVSNSYMSTPLYPYMITARGVADQYQYYVYTTYGSTTTVNGESEVGALVTLTPSNTITYRFDYSKSVGMNNSTYTYSGVGIQLSADEQVIAYRTPLGGWSTNSLAIKSGYLYSNAISQDGWSVWSDWINARRVLNGTLSFEDFSAQLTQARDSGYDDGWSAGIIYGRAEGIDWFKSAQLPTLRDDAFAEGFNEAIRQMDSHPAKLIYTLDIASIIGGVSDSIINFAQEITAYELFGINVSAVFGTVIATLVLMLVVGFILKLVGLLL